MILSIVAMEGEGTKFLLPEPGGGRGRSRKQLRSAELMKHSGDMQQRI